ncbi:hypothetical protein BKA69DRAFT_1089983 [Paraphysoderma sedebokerense]|nr:hypothetical protein BKA69DRAFT_1089983 [Paraphysoderma sedebokerense]
MPSATMYAAEMSPLESFYGLVLNVNDAMLVIEAARTGRTHRIDGPHSVPWNQIRSGSVFVYAQELSPPPPTPILQQSESILNLPTGVFHELKITVSTLASPSLSSAHFCPGSTHIAAPMSCYLFTLHSFLHQDALPQSPANVGILQGMSAPHLRQPIDWAKKLGIKVQIRLWPKYMEYVKDTLGSEGGNMVSERERAWNREWNRDVQNQMPHERRQSLATSGSWGSAENGAIANYNSNSSLQGFHDIRHNRTTSNPHLYSQLLSQQQQLQATYPNSTPNAPTHSPVSPSPSATIAPPFTARSPASTLPSPALSSPPSFSPRPDFHSSYSTANPRLAPILSTPTSRSYSYPPSTHALTAMTPPISPIVRRAPHSPDNDKRTSPRPISPRYHPYTLSSSLSLPILPSPARHERSIDQTSWAGPCIIDGNVGNGHTSASPESIDETAWLEKSKHPIESPTSLERDFEDECKISLLDTEAKRFLCS